MPGLPNRPPVLRTPGDVGLAYQQGQITYTQAYELLRQRFGFSDLDASELLGEYPIDETNPISSPIQESPVLPEKPGVNDNLPDSSGDNGLLETAGVFVVGVAKGTLIAAVPITAMAVAVGFMRRIVKFGVGVSS
tara:strand:+ start:90 stop:494 length:405 start_codon:yes stop_codon:yes gene_type:complete